MKSASLLRTGVRLQKVTEPEGEEDLAELLDHLVGPPVFPKFLAKVKLLNQSTKMSKVSPSKWHRSALIFSIG